jgi:hypothetical protein
MTPDGTVSTTRTLLRTVCFGVYLHCAEMVGEGADSSEDDRHGATPVVVRWLFCVSRYQRKNRCFKSFLSQLVSGDVLEGLPDIHGIDMEATLSERETLQ